MDNLHIGQYITEPKDRDAIHVAVIPVTTAVAVQPGDRVIWADKNARTVKKATDPWEFLGVIDPFLEPGIPANKMVWMFLVPGSINSLQHYWTHPDIPETSPRSVTAATTCEESERWLRDFCARGDCPEYDITIRAASGQHVEDDEFYGRAYNNVGDYLQFNGRDAHGSIPPEFWDHVQNVTGIEIPSYKRASYFGCSC